MILEVGPEKIISGKFLFHLIDSKGFPMDYALDMLRERGMGFNVPEFVEAAHKSKNFKAGRLLALLVDSQPGRHESKLTEEERAEHLMMLAAVIALEYEIACSRCQVMYASAWEGEARKPVWVCRGCKK